MLPRQRLQTATGACIYPAPTAETIRFYPDTHTIAILQRD
jgi:hypothetical protein